MITTSRGTFDLFAGQQRRERLVLSRLYDMTPAGEYRITVKRKFPASNGKDEVTVMANTITVKVDEGLESEEAEMARMQRMEERRREANHIKP